MNTQDELIDLEGRLSMSENRIQPKDKGTIRQAVQDIHMAHRTIASKDSVIESLEKQLAITAELWETCKSEYAKLEASISP